jgi:hypothetical protein
MLQWQMESCDDTQAFTSQFRAECAQQHVCIQQNFTYDLGQIKGNSISSYKLHKTDRSKCAFSHVAFTVSGIDIENSL